VNDAERDHDDLGRQDEVGADRALDLVALDVEQVGVGRHGRRQLLVVRRVLGRAVQEFVGQFLETFEAQVGAAHHQQRRDGLRQERRDRERGRHQDRLVAQRAERHRPDDRQLAVGIHAADLLGIQGQVVAQHAGRLLGRDLAHQGDVVEHAGDVVDQGQ
jgi:hypothetical protein